MGGLRERKKQAAMRHIQQTALRLFLERGFDQVTIEQVAEAADVSPSSVYRYFGTKEGLVLHDEYDETLLQVVTQKLAEGASALRALEVGLQTVAQGHFERDERQTLDRTGLWAGHRGIQAAAGAYVNELTEQVAQIAITGGRYDLVEARFIVAAIVHGLIAAILSWHQDGAPPPQEENKHPGLAALARVLTEE